MKLTAMKFISRFLQHTLPTGFMKVRHYGFMHSNCATKIQEIRELICVLYNVIKDMVDESPGDKIRKSIKLFTCRDKECGGIMIMVEFSFRPYYPEPKGDPPESGGVP